MSKFDNSRTISYAFEVGRRGKPDELDSNLATLIGAAFLRLEPAARFDLRVHGTSRRGIPTALVSGEASSSLAHDSSLIRQVVTQHYQDVHRHHSREVAVQIDLRPQATVLAKNGNAGDSGNPIAVAYANTPNHLPLERVLAVEIRDALDAIYQSGGSIPSHLAPYTDNLRLEGLRPDGKVSVRVFYDAVTGAVLSLGNIVIAVEHEPSLSLQELQNGVSKVVGGVLRRADNRHLLYTPDANEHQTSISVPQLPYMIIINGNGEWHQGGWRIDEGSREAKAYRDGFGPYGCLEDSIAGEDPSKPSGTGTFLARHLAVQLVTDQQELDALPFARVELEYVIGREHPTAYVQALHANDLGRAHEALQRTVSRVGSLSIHATIDRFRLRDPELYNRIARSSDFFYDKELPWNAVIRDNKV